MQIDSFIRFINRKIHYLIYHRGLRGQKDTILCVINIYRKCARCANGRILNFNVKIPYIMLMC